MHCTYCLCKYIVVNSHSSSVLKCIIGLHISCNIAKATMTIKRKENRHKIEWVLVSNGAIFENKFCWTGYVIFLHQYNLYLFSFRQNYSKPDTLSFSVKALRIVSMSSLIHTGFTDPWRKGHRVMPWCPAYTHIFPKAFSQYIHERRGEERRGEERRGEERRGEERRGEENFSSRRMLADWLIDLIFLCDDPLTVKWLGVYSKWEGRRDAWESACEWRGGGVGGLNLKGLMMSSEPEHQAGVVLPLQGLGKCSSECDSVCVRVCVCVC